MTLDGRVKNGNFLPHFGQKYECQFIIFFALIL